MQRRRAPRGGLELETGLRQSGGRRAICACQDLPGPTGDGSSPRSQARGRARQGTGGRGKRRAGRRKPRAASENNPTSCRIGRYSDPAGQVAWYSRRCGVAARGRVWRRLRRAGPPRFPRAAPANRRAGSRGVRASAGRRVFAVSRAAAAFPRPPAARAAPRRTAGTWSAPPVCPSGPP